MAGTGMARPGEARRGKAMEVFRRHGRPRLGRVRRGTTGTGTDGQGMAPQHRDTVEAEAYERITERGWPVKRIHGMLGLGDAIYQRPHVRSYLERNGPAHLSCGFPQLFADLPGVKLVKPTATTYATWPRMWLQQEAWDDFDGEVHETETADVVSLTYGLKSTLREHGSIVKALDSCIPADPYVFDLPPFVPSMAQWHIPWRPLAVIRPETIREEWPIWSRQSKEGYLEEIAQNLIDRGYFVVELVRARHGAERVLSKLNSHLTVETNVVEALGWVEWADVVVGGAGWIVPAAIAAGTPLFCVLGGLGAWNAPEVLTDPRMDLSTVHFAVPDRFCRCEDRRHTGCDKTISNLMEQWEAFIA